MRLHYYLHLIYLPKSKREFRMKQSIIKEIIKIPITMKKSNKSIYDLLLDLGCKENSDSLTKLSLANELKSKPNYLNESILYSENKRTNEGWYILAKEGVFEVAYLGDNTKIFVFKSAYEACAFFIKNEIETILKMYS